MGILASVKTWADGEHAVCADCVPEQAFQPWTLLSDEQRQRFDRYALHFYLDVRAGGRSLQAIVDSGSHYNIVDEGLLHKMN